jgi:hypothetical protein
MLLLYRPMSEQGTDYCFFSVCDVFTPRTHAGPRVLVPQLADQHLLHRLRRRLDSCFGHLHVGRVVRSEAVRQGERGLVPRVRHTESGVGDPAFCIWSPYARRYFMCIRRFRLPERVHLPQVHVAVVAAQVAGIFL